MSKDAERLEELLWYFTQADKIGNRLQFGLLLVDDDTTEPGPKASTNPPQAIGQGQSTQKEEKLKVSKELLELLDSLDACLAFSSRYADFSECRDYHGVLTHPQPPSLVSLALSRPHSCLRSHASHLSSVLYVLAAVFRCFRGYRVVCSG